MSVVIKVENLSKYYRLGLIGGGTLHEDLSRWWAMRRGKPDPLLMVGEEDHGNRKGGQIWALRDVSFEVQEGEILGIIGRNGAGKSTLLKILSRITAPTSGSAKIKGRVGSLLEVGTGFHPELTGRENIYLNGSILGMTRSEVTRKLEEIIEFAEMSQFIDTPVKRYSSGMTVRLAFAVAAHLEPEILIIDEVLAVGDAEFQKKCLGKMGDVASEGRTVLFVSHNMAAVELLCSRAVFLQNGEVQSIGETNEILSEYLGSSQVLSSDVDLSNSPGRSHGMSRILSAINVSVTGTGSTSQIPLGAIVCFTIQINPIKKIRYARMAIRFFNSMGVRVTTCHSEYQYTEPISIEEPTILKCTMHNCRLTPGIYSIELQLDDGRAPIDKVESALAIEVTPKDIYSTGRLLPPNSALYFPEAEWEVTNQVFISSIE